MNPTGEETVVTGADHCPSSSTENIQPQPASGIVATVENDGLSSQFNAEEQADKESLQSKESEQDQMKRSLELVGMKQMIDQMISDQEKLKKEMAKLTAQNESYQNEIRTLNEKLNAVMAAQKEDPNDELRRNKDLPILKMSPRCWSRAAWFRIYEDVMATNDKHLLKWCLMYYLSDEFQSKSFLEYFEKRNYDELKLMFLTSSEF